MAFNYDNGVFDFGFTKISLVEPDQLVSSEQLSEYCDQICALRDAYFDASTLIFLGLSERIITEDSDDITINIDLSKIYPSAQNIDKFFGGENSTGRETLSYGIDKLNAINSVEYMFKSIINASELVEKFKTRIPKDGKLTNANVTNYLNNHLSIMRASYGHVDVSLVDNFNEFSALSQNVHRYRTAINNIHIKNLLSEKSGRTVSFDFLRDESNNNTPLTSIRYLKVKEADLSEFLTEQECHEDDCLDSKFLLLSGVNDSNFESFSTAAMSQAWYANRLNYELSNLVLDTVKGSQGMKI